MRTEDGNTDDDLCQQHVDNDAETRKDDQDRAAKDASLDYTDESKIQTKKMTGDKKDEGRRFGARLEKRSR